MLYVVLIEPLPEKEDSRSADSFYGNVYKSFLPRHPHHQKVTTPPLPLIRGADQSFDTADHVFNCW